MNDVLLLCSSTDGHTLRICGRLRQILEGAGHAVTLTMIEDASTVSPEAFDRVVIGARIRYGKTDARVIRYANRHAEALNAMPGAFFSVNLVARKPAKAVRCGPANVICRAENFCPAIASCACSIRAARFSSCRRSRREW